MTRRRWPALALSLAAAALVAAGGCSKKKEEGGVDMTRVVQQRVRPAQPAAPGSPAPAAGAPAGAPKAPAPAAAAPKAAAPAATAPAAAPKAAAPAAAAPKAVAPPSAGKDNVAVQLPGKGAVPPLPAAPGGEAYSWAGKRNPFLPFIRPSREGKQRDLQKAPPLQRADISEFHYVGLMKTRKGTVALLETNDGKGYSVRVGDRLGREGGTVTAIGTKEITVRQTTVDSAGRSVVRDILIKNKNANAGGMQ